MVNNVGNSIPFDIVENILKHFDCSEDLRKLRLISSVWNYSAERRLLRDIHLNGQTFDSVCEGLEHKFKQDSELAGFVGSFSILWADGDFPTIGSVPRYTIKIMSLCTNIVNLDVTDLFEFLLTEDAIPALRNLRKLKHIRVRRTRIFSTSSTLTLPALMDVMQYWPYIESIDLSTCRLRSVNQNSRSYNMETSFRNPTRRCVYLRKFALHVSPTLTYGDVFGLERIIPRLETFSLTTDVPFLFHEFADIALSDCIEAWTRTLTEVTIKALVYKKCGAYDAVPYTKLTCCRRAIIALNRVKLLSIDRSVLLPRDIPNYSTLTKLEYSANGAEHVALATRVSNDSSFLRTVKKHIIEFIEEDHDLSVIEMEMIEKLYNATAGKWIQYRSRKAMKETCAYRHCVVEVQ